MGNAQAYCSIASFHDDLGARVSVRLHGGYDSEAMLSFIDDALREAEAVYVTSGHMVMLTVHSDGRGSITIPYLPRLPWNDWETPDSVRRAAASRIVETLIRTWVRRES